MMVYFPQEKKIDRSYNEIYRSPQRRSEVFSTSFGYASRASISINHIWPILMPLSLPERNNRTRSGCYSQMPLRQPAQR